MDGGDEKDQRNQEISGGFIRGLLKNILIRKVPTSAIRKSSETIGDLLELKQNITKSAAQNSSKDTKVNHKRFRKYGSIFISALPGYAKSSFLGTVLFMVYEKYTFEENSFLPGRPIDNAALVGGLAGVLNGSISLVWDIVYSKVIVGIQYNTPWKMNLFTPASHIPSISGTLVAHGIIHSSLFLSYEASKHVLHKHLTHPDYITCLADNTDIAKENLHQIIEITCIVVGGSVSGVVAEAMSRLVEPVELHGWQKGIRMMSKISMLPSRMLISAVLPSAVGFLAYEYGKEIIDWTT
jgi:hypothetical protein